MTGPILIVGAFKDPIAHKIFEDSFVASFKRIGIEAIPSYQYGLGTSQPTKEELRQIVKKSGASVFIITHVLSEKNDYRTVSHQTSRRGRCHVLG